MSVDTSRQEAWLEMQRRHKADVLLDPELPLKGGGGGGNYSGMDGRVSRLEALMEVTRSDLGEIKGDLRTVIDRLNDLPNKDDLNSWRWQWVATAIAIIALTVGGITGGLALIASYTP